MIIRALGAIIEYTDKCNIPGAMLTLDYTKAYDSLSKQFMITCLKNMVVGPNFERWISVINANTQSCISYCGWLSDWFPIERGIRQGCPLLRKPTAAKHLLFLFIYDTLLTPSKY